MQRKESVRCNIFSICAFSYHQHHISINTPFTLTLATTQMAFLETSLVSSLHSVVKNFLGMTPEQSLGSYHAEMWA